MALIKLGVNSGKGKVLQVVRTYDANASSHIETTSTSLTASGIQASITPIKSGNLILVDFGSTMVDHTGSSQDGYGRMYQKIGSGSIAAMASSHNYHIGYIDNGSNRYAPFSFSGSYTATSTDTLLYEPYIKSPSGGTFRLVHENASYALTLTEVEQ